MIAFSSIVHGQNIQSNSAINWLSITNGASTDNGPLLPLIQFEDVPITTAIQNLAGQAGINYIIDPKLFTISESTPEPIVTFTLKNVTAKDALARMLNLRNIVLIEDRLTTVAHITRVGQTVHIVDASLLGINTNNPSTPTNDIIPIIQFFDVPLEIGLENLIHQWRLMSRLTHG